LQILGSVSGVISAAMMGNAFAFQNAVGELNASVGSYTTPVKNNYDWMEQAGKATSLIGLSTIYSDNIVRGYPTNQGIKPFLRDPLREFKPIASRDINVVRESLREAGLALKVAKWIRFSGHGITGLGVVIDLAGYSNTLFDWAPGLYKPNGAEVTMNLGITAYGIIAGPPGWAISAYSTVSSFFDKVDSNLTLVKPNFKVHLSDNTFVRRRVFGR
jgi:hypothetical protein